MQLPEISLLYIKQFNSILTGCYLCCSPRFYIHVCFFKVSSHYLTGSPQASPFLIKKKKAKQKAKSTRHAQILPILICIFIPCSTI